MTFETFYQSDEETWPDLKRSTYLPTCQPPYKNNFKEQSHRFVTFETFDQSDEETWPDQKKDNDKDKDKDKDNDKDKYI